MSTSQGTEAARTTVGRNNMDYHLTPEQIEFFDTNGYLVLRNWIPADLLKRLQEAGLQWINDGLQAESGEDYVFADRPWGKALFRVNYVHNKGQSASLELLGSPQVLGVAESLCGQNFVPTYESMVFKQEGDGEAIAWHQDAVFPRKHRIFNYDLYLDPSYQGGGALRVIPKSQGVVQDICKLTDAYGWEHPDAIYVEMQPGDVLLHDVMIVHGSEHATGNALRCTIYYEFRAAEEILEDGPWDREWIDKRMRLIPLGLQAFQSRFPGSPQFLWQVTSEFQPQNRGDYEQELKIAHKVHLPGTYCSAGNAGKS